MENQTWKQDLSGVVPGPIIPESGKAPLEGGALALTPDWSRVEDIDLDEDEAVAGGGEVGFEDGPALTAKSACWCARSRQLSSAARLLYPPISIG